ncbi:hypothetical protein LR48_Vigan08g197900 [Vigna angularis]|uniref:Uncharacterized protein n=3 Tax=Phaseolus angularis TaxID=3914 RepID=A0A0L9V8C9_PHAAN|nr:zinc finger CCCH domain-containing protein 19 [Vigna angularis]KOM51152.1 hypothetical protein LR48_Vigan08g197900 [Vigna angularis]BAT91190.1 hypothetical protein VIGAN_06250300 [Vigna angularis var. angularis]
MDFHSLSRKQLQALCKKNKIPANITNLGMADALAALDQVEGLDEVLNSSEADVGTPNVNLRTAGRASSQRKATKAEVEGSTVKVSASARPLRGARVGVASGVTEQENKDGSVPPVTPAAGRRRATAVSTRRKKEVEIVEEDGDRNDASEVTEQENKDANVPPVTPAAGRRRATAVSTRKKKEVEIVEEDGDKNDAPKTVAAASVARRRATSVSVCTTKNETAGGNSVQRTYSTRRSVRLLENGLSKMSLIDTEDSGFVKIDDDDVSQELSNVSNQVEDSCHTEEGSSLQMDSTVVSEDTQESEVFSEQNTEYECQSHESASDVTEIDTVVEPHCSDEGEREKINCLELGAEPNESDEAGPDPLLDLEETCESSDLETENKEGVGACQESFPVEASADAMVPDNVSVDVTDQGVAGSLSMITDCEIYDEVNNKCGDQVSSDEDVNNRALVSQKKQVELMDGKISHESDDKEDKNNEPEVEDESDYSSLLEGRSDDQGSEVLPLLEDSTVATLEVLPSETSEVQVEVTYQDTPTLTVVVADEDVAASITSPGGDAPTGVNETMEYNTGDVNQDMKDETEEDEEYQLLAVEDKDAKESGSMIGSEGVPELDSISSSGELQAEVKPEQMEAVTHSVPDVAEAQAEESEEPVTGQVSVESASSPIDGEVVSEEVSAMPDQDNVIVSSENVSSDAPVQSVVSDPLKENVTSDDLHNKTMGELKRMLKNLKLGGEKSNCNKTTNKEVDKKRTALQVLPQNQMTNGEAQIDD